MERDTDGARLTGYVDEALEAVRAVPGVREAAMTSALPMQGWGFGMPFRVAGTQRRALEAAGLLLQDRHPRLLRRARHEAQEGPRPLRADAKGALPVAVVNETFARR